MYFNLCFTVTRLWVERSCVQFWAGSRDSSLLQTAQPSACPNKPHVEWIPKDFSGR